MSLSAACSCFVLCLPPISSAAQTPDLRELIAANHLTYLPEGSGPFPTIIAIPGCSGIAFQNSAEEASHPALGEGDRLFRSHYPHMAGRLRDEGFAVLLIQVHQAEGVITACRGEITTGRLADYIATSLEWADGFDFVDPDRMHVVGWSMGGRGVLAWLDQVGSAQTPARSAVAVYPGCEGPEPLTQRIPLLMLLGGADDIADPSVCEELVANSPANPFITVRTYPNARHGYDIVEAPPFVDAGNGRSIGSQPAAAEASWAEMLQFLSRE